VLFEEEKVVAAELEAAEKAAAEEEEANEKKMTDDDLNIAPHEVVVGEILERRQDQTGVSSVNGLVDADETLVVASDETTQEDTGVKMARTGPKNKAPTIPRPCHVIGHLSEILRKVEGNPWAEYVLSPLKDIFWPTVDIEPAYYPAFDETGATRYDWITDETIHGVLYGVNTLPSAASASLWRPFKTKVQIPCAFDGRVSADGSVQEALIVDHDRIYIVSMPTGIETGESYLIPRRDDDKRSWFKQLSCSLSERHILVMGYAYKTDMPSILVINRLDATMTRFCSSIAMASAILSPTQPDTFLLGMIDGTILRVNIPTKANGGISMKVMQNRIRTTIYPPKKNLGKDVLETILARPNADPSTVELLSLKKKADRVLHIGEPHPVTRIVERGKRIIASSCKGLHLFRLFTHEKQERRVNMSLEHNASYDFRGNLLAIHKV
jgi:hypothetical protein